MCIAAAWTAFVSSTPVATCYISSLHLSCRQLWGEGSTIVHSVSVFWSNSERGTGVHKILAHSVLDYLLQKYKIQKHIKVLLMQNLKSLQSCCFILQGGQKFVTDPAQKSFPSVTDSFPPFETWHASRVLVVKPPHFSPDVDNDEKSVMFESWSWSDWLVCWSIYSLIFIFNWSIWI